MSDLEYVVFDQDWLDVPIQDYPVGGIAVCRDPQKRLGEITWAVVLVENAEPPWLALGLFWNKAVAVRYAQAYCGVERSTRTIYRCAKCEVDSLRPRCRECLGDCDYLEGAKP